MAPGLWALRAPPGGQGGGGLGEVCALRVPGGRGGWGSAPSRWRGSTNRETSSSSALFRGAPRPHLLRCTCPFPPGLFSEPEGICGRAPGGGGGGGGALLAPGTEFEASPRAPRGRAHIGGARRPLTRKTSSRSTPHLPGFLLGLVSLGSGYSFVCFLDVQLFVLRETERQGRESPGRGGAERVEREIPKQGPPCGPGARWEGHPKIVP